MIGLGTRVRVPLKWVFGVYAAQTMCGLPRYGCCRGFAVGWSFAAGWDGVWNFLWVLKMHLAKIGTPASF